MGPLAISKRGAKLLQRMAFPDKPSFEVERPAPASWRDDRLTLACLGHATILMNLHGTMVLTDPVLMERVGFRLTADAVVGPKRLVPPALGVDELPRLDLLLLSHAHPDHMDLPTLARLPKDLTVVVPPNTADLVDACGFRDVRELPWGSVTEVNGARVRAVEVRHYGRRHVGDRRPGRGYNGYLVEKQGSSMFFGGDTAHTSLQRDLVPGGVDVAVFGIGGYEPFVWNHATPEQAFDMAQQLGAHYFLPMHWGTFKLSDEPIDEPIERLRAIARAASPKLVAETIGQTFVLPTTGSAT